MTAERELFTAEELWNDAVELASKGDVLSLDHFYQATWLTQYTFKVQRALSREQIGCLVMLIAWLIKQADKHGKTDFQRTQEAIDRIVLGAAPGSRPASWRQIGGLFLRLFRGW